MINIDSFQELVESMDIIAENKFKTASQIYYCLVKRITSGSKCVIDFNNKEYIVPYFAGIPRPNKTYALFLPQNNMNQAFVIGEGGSGGGGGSGIAVQPDPPTGDELVWIDTDDPGTIHIIPEIDDNNVSTTDTWSSQKISEEINEVVIGGTDFDLIYPIGSIYMSVNSTSPSILFGGTWEQLQDTFLLAAGTTYTAGDTGGSATNNHTHTEGDMSAAIGATGGSPIAIGYSPVSPNPRGPASIGSYTVQGASWTQDVRAFNHYTPVYGTTSAPSDNNNMPPYLAVYMWKRTA